MNTVAFPFTHAKENWIAAMDNNGCYVLIITTHVTHTDIEAFKVKILLLSQNRKKCLSKENLWQKE